MSEIATDNMREVVDGVYRAESRRVFATLIRLLGDFDVAEEALHDAFRAALEQWPREGVPQIRARGWCRQAASKRSTACAGARASMRLTESRSRISPTRAPPPTPRTSKTTGCG